MTAFSSYHSREKVEDIESVPSVVTNLSHTQASDVTPATEGRPGKEQFPFDSFASTKTIYKGEKLPPVDPKHMPLHAWLFLGGLLFFPLWYFGAFRPAEDNFGEMHRWRCQALAMITTIIIAAMLVMQLGFRTF
ncbi:unnamed protein product [Somion occarium]|uniref:Uncharacterized protein n=1 Tax=Somion occarium TaxID=3059160 RepID=A0ABP1CZW9_9APHY